MVYEDMLVAVFQFIQHRFTSDEAFVLFVY